MIDKLSMYLEYPFVRYALIVGILISLCSSLLGVTLAGCGSSSPASEAAESTASQKIDVDLASMSGTIAYSKVFDMINYPENYVGKTVRMEGLLSAFHYESTGKDYYSCLIPDATACCSQGIEFVLKDGQSYPNDGDPIVVTGKFTTYEEGEFTYCTLVDATLV